MENVFEARIYCCYPCSSRAAMQRTQKDMAKKSISDGRGDMDKWRHLLNMSIATLLTFGATTKLAIAA